MKTLIIATAIFSLIGLSRSFGQTDRAKQVRTERQHIADLGNGYFKNPVNCGGWGDPTVVRVGSDYYLAHTPGNEVMMWHSRDLVNWEPVSRQSLGNEFATIWASDLVYFNNKFHLYMPIGTYPGKTEQEKAHRYFKAVWVITAEKAEGPWSKPVRVDKHYNPDPFYSGIDPGFIQTPEGKKYLYLDNGFMMPLTADGLSSTAMPKVVYNGWDIPKDWVIQGKCLESPKLFYRKGYYYICSAMGGTSGPSTAHMATVARAKSPEGPWEESPFNPLLHTDSEEEPFWNIGHATILEGADGQWYTLFPAKYAWYTGMNKQTCLLPIDWTTDGWPVVKSGYKTWSVIKKPQGENVGHGMVLSDNFMAEPGIQWNIADKVRPNVHAGGGKLVLKASSDNQMTQIDVRATDKSYEATVEVECNGEAIAGLCFANNEGLKTDGKTIQYINEEEWRVRNSALTVPKGGKIYLKIHNYRQDLSFFGSTDGQNWTHFQMGVRAGEYVIRLFVTGTGEATFRNFTYSGLE